MHGLRRHLGALGDIDWIHLDTLTLNPLPSATCNPAQLAEPTGTFFVNSSWFAPESVENKGTPRIGAPCRSVVLLWHQYG